MGADVTVQLRCINCDSLAQPLDWRCSSCGGALDFADLPPFDEQSIDMGDFSLWRYAAMLPVAKRYTLGEGMTPLVETTIDGTRFYGKLEYLNPTGSYKDRGTTTMMNHIAAQGVSEVVEDSSGNAGASVAAYSRIANIHARIYSPTSAPEGKKALIKAFGAELIEIPGPQSAKTDACHEAAKTTTYASHAWSPYFILGQTTVAWEVWEQLGRTAPDAVATPVGHGGLFLGFARGFKALYEAGLIDKLPRLFAIQTEACDPIVRGWESGADVPSVITPQATVADGIIVDIPVRGKAVLSAIRESKGAAFRVNDDAVLAAHDTLAQHGFIVEPTSAVTLAALPMIRDHLDADDSLVMAFTGNGLKMVGRSD